MTRRIIVAVATFGCFLSGLGYVEAQTKTGKPAPTSAEVVYFSRHGKTYHKTQHCFVLSRSAEIFEAPQSAAEAHGLRQCHVCYRTLNPAKPNTGADSWAKPAPEEKQ